MRLEPIVQLVKLNSYFLSDGVKELGTFDLSVNQKFYHLSYAPLHALEQNHLRPQFLVPQIKDSFGSKTRTELKVCRKSGFRGPLVICLFCN